MDLEERYMRLPEPVKMQVTLNEFRWMSDEQRENILTDLTEPDIFED